VTWEAARGDGTVNVLARRTKRRARSSARRHQFQLIQNVCVKKKKN